MLTKEKKTAEQIQESYEGEREDLESLYQSIRKRPADEQESLLQTLERYDAESKNDSYNANPSELISLLVKEEVLSNSKSLVDLGAGSGNVIKTIASRYPQLPILGIDLSPGFVSNFNTNPENTSAGMRLGLIDSADLPEQLGGWTEGDVISVLTLDRVANPRQFLQNMGLFKGRKILATLLPVVPEDDNPSRQKEGEKIMYTKPENRIVRGETVDQDRDDITLLLQEIWGATESTQIPYTVESSGDTQAYTLQVFMSK